MKKRKEILIVFMMLSLGLLRAQGFVPNYDESKVPEYELPDPLIFQNGKHVTDSEEWLNKRRQEIIDLFETHVYGKAPLVPDSISFRQVYEDSSAHNGIATRKEIIISIYQNRKSIEFNLLIYLPNNNRQVHPLFLGLNFYGNHSISPEKGITLSGSWMRKNDSYGIVNHKATEASRGVRKYRWPVEYILQHGYGLATIYCGDIDPDYDDGFQNGIHPLFYGTAQTKPDSNQWGTIAAWSWGLSRAMDYLELDNSIDKNRVIVFGHSRLGKAALWAGATDTRFALVISNNSGCGGAALSRRRFGETVEKINNDFPHWFCENFKKYNDSENNLPVDQHMLIALNAPRPVYVASAEDDLWADPRGEFLSARYAGDVYTLFELKGLATNIMPEVNNPVMNVIGYHVRTGGHDVKLFDWQQFIKFADKNLQSGEE